MMLTTASPTPTTRAQTRPENSEKPAMIATSPAAPTTRPSNVATRSGRTEKFTHALSHKFTSRRSV